MRYLSRRLTYRLSGKAAGSVKRFAVANWFERGKWTTNEEEEMEEEAPVRWPDQCFATEPEHECAIVVSHQSTGYCAQYCARHC